jgi:hypothetical protein
MKKKVFKFISPENFNATVLLVLLFFSSSILFAQEIPVVNVTFKLKILNGDLKSSQITITKTDAPYIVIDPNKEGDAVDLPLGFEYSITFTKTGYNTKRMLVDTHVPENRERGDFERQISEVTLEKLSGKLEDNYVQMIGKIKYSMSKADFDFDKVPAAQEDKTKKIEKPPLPPNPKPITSSPKQNQPLPAVVNKSEPVSKTKGKNKVVKVISEDYKKITIITITIDGKDIIYKKEEYDWGTFFYKDGKRITGDTYTNETL